MRQSGDLCIPDTWVCWGLSLGAGRDPESAVPVFTFADEDTPMQESNLPKVPWPLREGASPSPAPAL